VDDLEDYKNPGTLARDQFFSQIMVLMIKEGINQSDLARRLGVSRMAVSQMFRRRHSVTLERAEKVARVLGKTLNVYLTDRLDSEGDL
jgi:transcriptional regulator with XRE-family HTH domain